MGRTSRVTRLGWAPQTWWPSQARPGQAWEEGCVGVQQGPAGRGEQGISA